MKGERPRERAAQPGAQILPVPPDERRRRPPQLVITIPLESIPDAQLHSETFEDQQRFYLWLRRSSTVRDLAYWLGCLQAWLDELEDLENEAA